MGSNEQIWNAWTNQLSNFVFSGAPKPDNQQLSVTNLALSVDFANSSSLRSSAQIYRVGNTVLSDSSTYNPVSRLDNAYGEFLNLIPDSSAGIKKGIELLESARQKTQNSYNMPVILGQQSPAGSGGTSSDSRKDYVPAYYLDSSFITSYGDWQAASVRGDHTNGGVFTITALSTEPTTETRVEETKRMLTSTSGDTESLLPFLRVGSFSSGPSEQSGISGAGGDGIPSGSGSEVSSSVEAQTGTSSESFDLKVQFTGLGVFSIEPGGWWNDTLVKMYSGDLDPRMWNVFFGSGGSLARITYQLLIGFGPSLILTFKSKEELDRASITKQLGDGYDIQVGPIIFSGGNKNTEGSTNLTKTGNQIIINPAPSTLPILIGAVSTRVLTGANARPPIKSETISVKNDGAFVAMFEVKYDLNGSSQSAKSKNFSAGNTKTLAIPSSAKNITISVLVYTLVNVTSVVATYQSDKAETRSFVLSGTTLHPKSVER